MIIDLKQWQKYLVLDLLDALPFSVREPLEASVTLLAYIEKQTGDGFYKNKVAYISRGIRHPRLMLERTCHEWGHGIDEWLAHNGFHVHPYSPERMADGFALSILYPDILHRQEWENVRIVYRNAFYKKGFPNIDTERLIGKYSRIVREISLKSKETMGSDIYDRLEDFFDSQSKGFLKGEEEKLNSE